MTDYEMTEERLEKMAKSFREDADAHISDLCREWTTQILGTNCTWVDDDLRLLAHLANRAVKAGLTDELPKSVLPYLPV